ncbi:uncharacterized protein LOC131227894 isoform X3 [Magnolia sinica]|uniref:uncharacterized protein LOC131227894 isoform X3 n=1 Tax=Magnolia sinica TaxID=86752 RepID=UPI00265AFD14|nr:uncharacterized protein LOC131227894 isoform X3 [Magnolia sinica]
MGLQNTSSPSKTLDGVHGVHLLPHSPFTACEISQHEDCNLSTYESSRPFAANQRLLMTRVWQQRPPCFRPIHCNLQGDQNLAETIVNVLTSLPFVALGIQVPRKNMNNALYANSLIGVGVASSLYHCSRGDIRKYLRWADYTMIATATVVAFAKRAFTKPELRMAHNLHKMSSILGGALFIADDLFPSTPYIHAAWHLAAAVGVGTCNKLLE